MIYKHVKRGSWYGVISERATVQAEQPIKEGDEVVVYIDADRRAWVRPRKEFFDGRFEAMPKSEVFVEQPGGFIVSAHNGETVARVEVENLNTRESFSLVTDILWALNLLWVRR